MLAVFKLLAMTALASAVDLATLKEDVHAGALSMYVNTTSVNNMMQIFVPILSYYMLNNQTFVTNITESSILYKLTLDSVHVQTVDGFTEKSLTMIPGTDKVRLVLSGINATVDLNGSFSALHFIPMDATQVTLTNMTIDFTLEQVNAGDKVHWALKDSSKFHFDNMSIKMKSSFLQKLVDISRKLIDGMVNDMLPKLSKYIDTQIMALNKEVAGEGPMTFVFPLMNDSLALNMTMAHAPITEVDSNLIGLFFDGMVVGDKVKTKTDDITALPPRVAHDLSEQIYIHEDMVDSLVQQLESTIFPVELNDKSLSDQMKQVFREIPTYYGNDATVALKLSMDTGSGKPLHFDKTHGIVIGDKTNITTTLELLCSNKTTANASAVVFTMDLETHVNMTLKDFVVYPNIKEVFTENAVVKKDNIGMLAHNYNVLFTSILKNFANDMNVKYAKGYPLANLNPVFGMLSGLIKNFTVTPYQEDNYLYAGFSMQADLPTAPQPVEFIQ